MGPLKQDVDISLRPDGSTGKQGKWHSYHDFQAQRGKEYTDKGLFPDWQERKRAIGEDWQTYGKKGIQPPPVEATPAVTAGGAMDDDDDIADAPVSPCAASPVHETG